MTLDIKIRRFKRISVDPNGASRLHPDWIAALYSDADAVPEVGETVLAVQPDDGGPDYVTTAIVKRLNPEHGLIFLDVDWDNFHDELSSAILGREIQMEHVVGARRGSNTSAALLGLAL